jgi:hypothetical protein
MIRALAILVLVATAAQAHDLRPGVLAFVENEPGELAVRFVPPIDTRGEAVELALVLPDGCTRKGDRVHCENGFGGELAVGGMRGHAMKIYVSLTRDGARRDWVLTSEQPRVNLGQAPPANAHAKIAAGVHAFGDVHVAFALALLVLFGVTRRLALALAALTATSALAGLLGFAAPLAVVALSLVLVARAALRDTAMPWWTIAAFGVAHGITGGAWLQVGAAATRAAIVGLGVVLVLAASKLIGERRVVRVGAHRAGALALGALAVYWLLRGLASG